MDPMGIGNDTVDGFSKSGCCTPVEGTVVYSIIYRDLQKSQVVVWEFFHQQHVQIQDWAPCHKFSPNHVAGSFTILCVLVCLFGHLPPMHESIFLGICLVFKIIVGCAWYWSKWIVTFIPIGSMYGIFTYIYHKNQPNVGIYTIHGSYG